MMPLVVLFVVIFVVVSMVLSVFVCIVLLEAVVAPLHPVQMETLNHVGSEDLMVVLRSWHEIKFFHLHDMPQG